MKNFSDAEIGITRSDLRRMIEYWYNEECNKYNDKRRKSRGGSMIKGQGFDKRYTKKFSGKVIRREKE